MAAGMPRQERSLAAVSLNEVIPAGRFCEKYRRMFALAGVLAGCGDGPAGCSAGATAEGRAVASREPACAASRVGTGHSLGAAIPAGPTGVTQNCFLTSTLTPSLSSWRSRS